MAEKPPRLRPGASAAAPPLRPHRVPVRPDHGAVHDAQAPVEPPLGVRLAPEFGRDAAPDPDLLPATEAAVDGPPRAEPLGRVAPGGTGAQGPEAAPQDKPVILGGPAGAGLLGREQWAEALPPFVRRSGLVQAGEDDPPAGLQTRPSGSSCLICYPCRGSR